MTPDATESKTIRIDSETYTRLAMLAGYFSALRGETQSVSDLANTILSEHCDDLNPKFEKLFAHPEAFKKIQEKARSEFNRIGEIFKLMKVKE